MTETTPTREIRVHTSLLAPLEKRCLIWMATRVPDGIHSDHLTALGALALLAAGGCYAAGGHMSPVIAGSFLIAYYLLSIEIALATHTVGVFRISYWRFGPTELRILLAIGTLQLMRSGSVVIAGFPVLLFDVGGAIATLCLAATFLASAAANTRRLYRAEPLPTKHDGAPGHPVGSFTNRPL